MTAPKTKTAPGAQFVRLTRDVLTSAAWRGLGINARRFLDFLMAEHLNHGGQENGKLIAPRLQLEEYGIGARHISGAIEETVEAGLVTVRRGIGKRPSVYTLNWLERHDGTMPPRRWLVATSEGKSLRMTSEGKSSRVSEGKSQGPSDFRREVTNAVPRVSEGKSLYRGSYRRSDNTTLSGESAGRAEPVNGPPAEPADLDGEVQA